MKREQLNRLATELKAQVSSIIDDEIVNIVEAMDMARAAHQGPGRFAYRFGIGASLEPFEPFERLIVAECRASWATKHRAERSGEVRLEPDMLDGAES